MSGMTCDDVRTVAAELALDVLPADERARVLDHLDDCPVCRELVDGYVRASDSLLLALPDAPVPSATAAAIRATKPVAQIEVRRRMRGRWMLAAAATVMLVVVAVAVVAQDEPVEDEPGEVAVGLVAADGDAVGTVTLEGGDDPWIWMAMAGVDDATYRCEVVFDDGTTAAIGRLTVIGGHGAWDAPIAFDLGDVSEVHVVAPDGTIVASASV